MSDDFRVEVVLKHDHRGWHIEGRIPKPGGGYSSYEEIFDEPSPSIQRVIEVAEVSPEVSSRVRARLREVAEAAERSLESTMKRTRDEAERARERVAEEAVKARLARDVADSYPPLDQDIPF